jgi:hypothetical protein
MAIGLALLGSLAIVPTAFASPGKTINTGTQTGTNPVTQVSATGKKPKQMRIGVDSPAGAKVQFTIACAKTGSVKKTGSSYATTTPSDIRQVTLPTKKASSCQLTATARFSTAPQTGTLTVTLYSTKQK